MKINESARNNNPDPDMEVDNENNNLLGNRIYILTITRSRGEGEILGAEICRRFIISAPFFLIYSTFPGKDCIFS